MNSPSRQCDFAPFELPFTQLEKVVFFTHGSSVNGFAWPFVHWSMFAAESVNVAVATRPLDPVAVTEYVAMNEDGRLNTSVMLPAASACTVVSCDHVWPTSSFTTMWTLSLGNQFAPVRVTWAPGA